MNTGNSIIDSITVQDFKTRFYRGFNYVNNWDETKTYNIGEQVFYEVNNKFYQCSKNTTISVPTTITDWILLDSNQYTSDLDIYNSYDISNFRIDLKVVNNNNAKYLFLLLSAHCLYININNLNGLSISNQGNITSESVGDLSASYQVPDYMLKDPSTVWFQQSKYGIEYYAYINPILQGLKYQLLYGTTSIG